MRPCPRGSIRRSAARTVKNVPFVFTAKTRSHSWEVISSSGNVVMIPAQVTRPSIRPNSRSVRSKTASISERLVTSARRSRTSPASSAAVAFSRSASKSASTSRAPSREAACAMARPMPDAPPVMTKTRPRRFRKSATAGSEAAAPEAAVTPQHERQVLLVAGPALIFRQLQILFDAVPAPDGPGLNLQQRRSVLQERQLILHVLLGAETAAGTGMAGDQLVPVHRQHLLHRIFRPDRLELEQDASRR